MTVPDSKSPDVPTAFVFAGGGSLGAVQVGMLSALVADDHIPDFVVGSSVGAINAVFFATNPNLEGVERLRSVWLRLRRRDVFPVTPLRAFAASVSNRLSLISPSSLRRLLEREIRLPSIQSSPLGIHIVTTRMRDGTETVFSTGDVIPPLMASMAIPGVFPPVEIDGLSYIDGGVASNTPIAPAVRLGARRVVVLPTGSPCSAEQPPKGALGVAIHALNLLVMRQLLHDLQYYEDQVELIVVPPLCPLEYRIHDFSHTAELMQLAEDSTRSWLATYGFGPHGIPHEMKPHVHHH